MRWTFVAGVGLAAALAGCAEDVGPSQEMQRAIWSARLTDMSSMGLVSVISQQGSDVTVTVTNQGNEPKCIGESGWPDRDVMLDHFLVVHGGSIVPYSGRLASVVGPEDELRLEPKTDLILQLNIDRYYLTDWQAAEVESFWAPFYPCEDADAAPPR